jgi:hypothetical protein
MGNHDSYSDSGNRDGCHGTGDSHQLDAFRPPCPMNSRRSAIPARNSTQRRRKTILPEPALPSVAGTPKLLLQSSPQVVLVCTRLATNIS